jgi:sialidase-1
MVWTKQTSTNSGSIDYLTSNIFAANADFSSQYFRIPFMCTTNQGTIIAGSDIRYSGSADFGSGYKIDIGVARSTDGGATWTNKKVVISNNNLNNYSRAMDATIIYDSARNKIYIFAVKFDNTDSASWSLYTDRSIWDVVYVVSSDDGLTWSNPTSIKSVINPYSTSERKIFFGGVGSGIVMSNGTIVLPIQCSTTGSTVNAGIVYSTDAGVTWQMSNSLLPEYTSECNVVEYETGKLLINARNDRDGKRALYYTTDMGTTWTAKPSNATTSKERLVQVSGCMGSTIKATLFNGVPKILYSAPHTNDNTRKNISVMYSNNAGDSWKMVASVYSGLSDGYSCLSYFNNKLYIVLEISGSIIFKDITPFMRTITQDDIVWVR